MKKSMVSELPRYCLRCCQDLGESPPPQPLPAVPEEKSGPDTPQSTAIPARSSRIHGSLAENLPKSPEIFAARDEDRPGSGLGSGSSMLLVERFGGARFNLWKMRMQMLLVLHDQWGVVSGSTPPPDGSAGKQERVDFERKDAKARANILLHLEDRQLMQVWNTTSAKQAWDLLVEMYTAV